MTRPFGIGMLVLLVLAACRTHGMKDPVIVHGAGDVAKNATAVQKAVEEPANRDPKLWWHAETKEAQKWELKFESHGHMVKVTVTWDEKDISIAYRDSSGLKDDAAKRSISDTYNSWVQNLAGELDREVAKLR